jgi:hypothetical protein
VNALPGSTIWKPIAGAVPHGVIQPPTATHIPTAYKNSNSAPAESRDPIPLIPLMPSLHLFEVTTKDRGYEPQ